jgi:hypothetical protein
MQLVIWFWWWGYGGGKSDRGADDWHNGEQSNSFNNTNPSIKS